MAIDIRRREFIFTLGGAAAAWPLAVRAQQSGKLPTIGFGGPPRSMRAHGWRRLCSGCANSVGSTVATSRLSIAGQRAQRARRGNRGRVRPAQGRCHRRGATAAPLAAKQATTVIPIVSRRPPTRSGRAWSRALARPGGNVTGVVQKTDTGGK